MSGHFPLFIDIENKNILVVGAGKVAGRRIASLLDFGPELTVIARDIPDAEEPYISSLEADGRIQLIRRAFKADDILEEYFMVIAATDSEGLNREIVSLCRGKGILANSASDRNVCDFYFPAVVRRDNLVIGIAGDGTDHRAVADLAAELRKEAYNED